MPEVRGLVRGPAVAVWLVLAIALLALPVLLAPLPAEAAVTEAAVTDPVADPVERIPTYDVVMTIRADGVVHVRETITYDFDVRGEHGIVLSVPYRRHNRLYDVRDVRTSSSTGAPARADTLKLLHDVQITVGNMGHRVHGRQAYVIEYDLAWAITPYADRDEFLWNAIGTYWDVPIGEAAVRVEAPVPLRHVGCLAGTATSYTRCLRDRDGPFAIDFTQTGLRPHEGVMIKVRLPKGAIVVPPPHYARPHWTGSWAGSVMLVLALGSVGLVARRPTPRPRVGEILIVLGTALVVLDVVDDVAARGLWAFSLGDGCLAGLALVIIGAAALGTYRFRAWERAAVTGRGD
ncbi:DUF2207 domain-containing protein [Actinomadura barringtoniae]|uniref:DUF2207 domain-containing protein n=1 Tax=Actinomadura barringtoniae TaxID=1427535 RepID=A0A939PDP3_9ACTN|nr:DUF2207 domain-containing protein [Actinomadura barringtoniae]MBO2448173.1 DUF2207 domain-containing protein [Actinomadura barringtoniae]